MAITEAFVTYADDNITLIRTKRETACEGCAEQATCSEGRCDYQLDTKVLNNVGAKKGDEVLISYSTKSILKITFLVYVVPIVFLILGAVIGDNLAEKLMMSKSFSALVFAFGFLAISIAIIKIYNNKLEKKKECMATIIKVL